MNQRLLPSVINLDMTQERLPTDQERRLSTLIFKTPSEAQEFAERVSAKSIYAASPGVARPREILAEEVAAEMARYGESVGSLYQPWEHTKEEHEQVQKLVDIAFIEDLPAALRRAKKSEHYPRIIDLLHDVLTGEMYEALTKRELNKQKIINKQAVLAAIIIMILVAVALVAAALL